MLNGNRVNAIRARLRRGWPIKKIASVFGVARNTVRRYTRQGTASRAPPTSIAHESDGEMDLVREIARHQRTTDHDELESALTFHLAELRRKKGRAQNWKGLLITALNRKAKTWLKKRALEDERFPSLDAPIQSRDPDAGVLGDAIGRMDIPPEHRLTLRAVRRKLTQREWQILQALKVERFNKTRAARRLGVHPNTIHNALRRIRARLKKRGWTF